ncbi:MAG: formate dehydrogenase subunit gamma, partial [Gammaproteobacteria bacterium]|nr:formate dehydrogenase subunit gamma [Gammaproteobacteria bacterium]
ILFGLVVSISGLVLVSLNFGQGRVIMEIPHLVHVVGSLLLMLGSLGHMYMGTIGIEGRCRE